MTRIELADIIFSKIEKNKALLQEQYNNSKDTIGYFFIDNILPEKLALEISCLFPNSSEMVLKKSIREDKYIGVQMNQYNNLLEEVLYAFQDDRIVKLISEITEITNPYPDENLYAGGISLMKKNQFLNPHLDNSHDKDRERWRVLNLLYYVSPNWKLEYG